jgi:predicted nucleotidyltransferase
MNKNMNVYYTKHSQSEIISAMQLLNTEYADATIYIFGSQVAGTATKYSDLDIFMIFPELPPNVFQKQTEIRRAADKYITIPKDIFIVDQEQFEFRCLHVGTLEYSVFKHGIKVA